MGLMIKTEQSKWYKKTFWQCVARGARLRATLSSIFFKRKHVSSPSLLNQLLMPLTLIMLLLLSGFMLLLVWQYHQQIDSRSWILKDNIAQDFREHLSIQAKALEQIALGISFDPRLSQMLKTHNHAGLLQGWQPLYDKLRSEHNICHLHFLDRDRVCLMRMRKPDVRGDVVERFTALQAERTKNVASGIELGSPGIFFLCAVQPVFENGVLIGYVELGKEVEEIFNQLKQVFKVELAVIIRKKYIQSAKYEAEMSLLRRALEWERFSRHAVIFSTQGRLPDIFTACGGCKTVRTNKLGEFIKDIKYDGKHWRAVAVPLQDAAGSKIGYLLTQIDITADKVAFHKVLIISSMTALVFFVLLFRYIFVLLRRTEKVLATQQADLQTSCERFNQLAENNRTIVWETDEQGLYKYCNSTLRTVLGFTSEELVGKRYLWDLHPEAGREALKNLLMDFYMRQEAIHNLIKRYRTKDGADLWMVMDATPVVDKTGALLGYRGSFIDITEQKNAEDEREWLITAIEQAGEAVVITDINGTILKVNPVFTNITGYTSEEAVGKNIRILKSGKHEAAFYQELWQTLVSGKTWQGRFVNRRKDGSFYTEASTISPVYGVHGKTIHYVAVKRDISEHLRLEEMLHQAQKMESIGRLAGGVAHDFNNMLQIILGNTEMAMMSVCPDDALQADLQAIKSAAKRSSEITQQLLAFACKQVIVPQALDLNQSIVSMLNMLKNLVGEKVEILWRPTAKPCTVKMDVSQLQQVLANLVLNARDAISAFGKLVIETDTEFLDQDSSAVYVDCQLGEYVVLTISDNGCGMDKNILSHLFEPFFTTKRLGEGTGLGLATVYGIIKQNKGCIKVYSELGVGSTFKIYLPVHIGQAQVLITEPSEQTTRGHGETILLVEDESALLKLAQAMLEKLGYTVLAANSASEALRLVVQHGDQITLLLTDVIMPGMNGGELAKRLKVTYPQVKCLFMSGYMANVTATDGVIIDEHNFIQKPFTFNKFAAKIREILSAPLGG